MPFKQMENVSNFIKACGKLGVPEYALFTTPDLYDGKSVVNVTNGIIALGFKAQSLPGYDGPKIGAKNSTAAPGSQKQSKWKIGAGGGGVSKMMMGSAGVMQRGDIQVGRQDMAARIGAGTAGATSKMMQGSAAARRLPSSSPKRLLVAQPQKINRSSVSVEAVGRIGTAEPPPRPPSLPPSEDQDSRAPILFDPSMRSRTTHHF